VLKSIFELPPPLFRLSTSTIVALVLTMVTIASTSVPSTLGVSDNDMAPTVLSVPDITGVNLAFVNMNLRNQ
jgi:hypothetical protein